MKEVKDKIIEEMGDVVKYLGGASDILSIIFSCGDTLEDTEIVRLLKEWNDEQLIGDKEDWCWSKQLVSYILNTQVVPVENWKQHPEFFELMRNLSKVFFYRRSAEEEEERTQLIHKKFLVKVDENKEAQEKIVELQERLEQKGR